MKVGVIGAGPAGITIAIILARRGYKVTVFETREKIGGILRYGIPEFRLPKSILDRYYRRMRDMGIMFRPNFELGGSTSIQDLFDDGYRSVFVGTGAWKPRKLGVPGETFGHVFYAINYLNNPDVYELGDKVAIVGAGNAAMDVARTAIRHGSRDVTVYVRSDKVAASENEFNYAVLDGGITILCNGKEFKNRATKSEGKASDLVALTYRDLCSGTAESHRIGY